MKKWMICFGWIAFSLATYGQQQAMYTQYMFNALAINPAYASVDPSFVVTALARQQWVGFKGAPSTQTLSLHSPLGTSNTAAGAVLINDQIGEVLKETGGYLTLSQKVRVSDESYLAVGINGGLASYRATYSDDFSYSPASVNDPIFGDGSELVGDFGFGVMLFSETYYAGFSSPNFYQRNLTSYSKKTASLNYKPHFLAQGGLVLPIGYDLKFKPSCLFKYVDGAPLQVDVNANVLIKEKLWLGASYRSAESLGALASLYITPDIQFAYSYDFVNTALAKAQSGSHEIMLKFSFGVRGRERYGCYF